MKRSSVTSLSVPRLRCAQEHGTDHLLFSCSRGQPFASGGSASLARAVGSASSACTALRAVLRALHTLSSRSPCDLRLSLAAHNYWLRVFVLE